MRGASALSGRARASRDRQGQRQRPGILVPHALDRKDAVLRPESALAGLPRLVRVADETRWRGQSAVATALVVAAYWGLTWLVGETVEPVRTLLAFVVVAVPTLLVTSLATGRRMRESLERTTPPPRASVHETLASSRDRRMKLAGMVLTGIVALLLFERFTDSGGVMAGLIAGLLAAVGVADWREAGYWDAAERERETRIYVLIRPDALTPRLGASDVYETPRPGAGDSRRVEPSPFDLEI